MRPVIELGTLKESEQHRQAGDSLASNLLGAITSGSENPDAQLAVRDQIDSLLFQEFRQILAYRSKSKELYKRVFFWCALGLLGFVFLGSAAAIGYLVVRKTNETAAIVTAVGGAVSTLLGLPLIIANYLFNKEEDGQITQQVLSLRASDIEHRKLNKETERIHEQRDIPVIPTQIS